jgi:glycerol-3-phosphate dehydrogenase (NAD(P)+)
MNKNTIVIAGAGAIGTALGNVLAEKEGLEVTLLSIEPDVVESINSLQINSKYFPGIRLHPRLHASTDKMIAKNAEIVFFAVPSVVVKEVADSLHSFINNKTILANLAKGYGNGSKTVAEILNASFTNPVVSFKGPAFARELINQMPTGFTVGSSDSASDEFFRNMAKYTSIYLDFSNDLRGVELVSILKNIYAIAMGIVDAHFNSPNLRFLVFTKAFNEIKELLLLLGGKEETLFNYCGIGDFGLTALNDLSRNRTLGLLIGKGFFTETISDKVVLEGRMAIQVIKNEISEKMQDLSRFPIFKELFQVFSGNYNHSMFVTNILNS